MSLPLRTLNDMALSGKTVLVRVDLNVPMSHGTVDDYTRITRLAPTLNYLIEHHAKVVVLSHFDRPKGKFVLEMSLAPLADHLSTALGGKEVKFAVNSIGHEAENAVAALQPGEIILLENVRFHAGEETNDPAFIQALAALGDIYVNDTFSCSHRAHASIVGLADALPSCAGFLLQDELENLEQLLLPPARPVMAIVGGSKVSTKLELLHFLVDRVDSLVIGGAMANTFLKARGLPIGRSLYEADLVESASDIMTKAKKSGCNVNLPQDVVVAESFKEKVPCDVVEVAAVDAKQMILDIGPKTVAALSTQLESFKTVVWNGPMGAFELKPFDVGTTSLAQRVAELTRAGQLCSVAGGGDIVSALGNAGLIHSFTYISTAGGAFLEWLEGKDLPGISCLRGSQRQVLSKAAAGT